MGRCAARQHERFVVYLCLVFLIFYSACGTTDAADMLSADIYSILNKGRELLMEIGQNFNLYIL